MTSYAVPNSNLFSFVSVDRGQNVSLTPSAGFQKSIVSPGIFSSHSQRSIVKPGIFSQVIFPSQSLNAGEVIDLIDESTPLRSSTPVSYCETGSHVGNLQEERLLEQNDEHVAGHRSVGSNFVYGQKMIHMTQGNSAASEIVSASKVNETPTVKKKSLKYVPFKKRYSNICRKLEVDQVYTTSESGLSESCAEDTDGTDKDVDTSEELILSEKKKKSGGKAAKCQVLLETSEEAEQLARLNKLSQRGGKKSVGKSSDTLIQRMTSEQGLRKINGEEESSNKKGKKKKLPPLPKTSLPSTSGYRNKRKQPSSKRRIKKDDISDISQDTDKKSKRKRKQEIVQREKKRKGKKQNKKNVDVSKDLFCSGSEGKLKENISGELAESGDDKTEGKKYTGPGISLCRKQKKQMSAAGARAAKQNKRRSKSPADPSYTPSKYFKHMCEQQILEGAVTRSRRRGDTSGT